jgi:cytochrome c oxidase assembly factor 6
MGAGSSKEASLPPPKISSDGAPIAPDRSQRSHCWEARDLYFDCLEKNGIVDSIKEKDKAEKACSTEGRGFEANCASSWVRSCGIPVRGGRDTVHGNIANHLSFKVTYFKKRRVMEYQRNQTLEKLKSEGANDMSAK